jgi:hypothetical protein
MFFKTYSFVNAGGIGFGNVPTKSLSLTTLLQKNKTVGIEKRMSIIDNRYAYNSVSVVGNKGN